MFFPPHWLFATAEPEADAPPPLEGSPAGVMMLGTEELVVLAVSHSVVALLSWTVVGIIVELVSGYGPVYAVLFFKDEGGAVPL